MSSVPDLSISALVAGAALLLIPLFIDRLFGLGLARDILIATFRMAVQLAFAGLYLTWLFQFDHPLLNLAWLGVMMLVAALTTVQKSALRVRCVLLPVAVSTTVSTLVVVLYMNAFVVRLDDLFAARYLVVLGGMILGNSLAGNIVALNHCYTAMREGEARYHYWLGNGAQPAEARRPFVRESIRRALLPTVAGMATMGIVSLPGMMTGQMLGGSSPMVATKYQVAIMLAIFASVALGVSFALQFSARFAFDEWGVLRREIFRSDKDRDGT